MLATMSTMHSKALHLAPGLTLSCHTPSMTNDLYCSYLRHLGLPKSVCNCLGDDDPFEQVQQIQEIGEVGGLLAGGSQETVASTSGESQITVIKADLNSLV